ncbi:MotE family protein [Sporosarcina sp. YIM B06819]|uniref:MotE family protein n=1 Tax=Sporosarcina sp. YIM B06819 TaxID=3081769 RepID=UPI00298C849B|nr:MotE family protein [Sporosarcina sp. YIM B06819]
MPKKNKEINTEFEVEKGKSAGIFQILLLWIFIPLLFASAVLLIIAKFADINVFDKAQEWSGKLPFVGEKNEEQDDAGVANLVLGEQVVALQAEIKEKEAELFKVQGELDKSVSEKEKLLLEQQRLNDEIAQLISEKDISKKEFNGIVTTYEQMSPKSIAPVITKMTDGEAVRILASLKPDTLAAVLEKMAPEDAAKYTSLLTGES